ncbi:hypothetical protein E1286_04795 [Nonomuraea terrae]|uniref:GTPase RsgA n=1 Tax=Nonomuraea terrae TaxID=2530383 RepID=A0A4R4ZB24_9ACTN|nr:hypothetical protein E1286_04795 [Nonomuraea terrae]
MADYGWDTERERSFAPSRAEGLVPGRVVRAERGLCDVIAETGPVRAVVLPSSGTGDRLTPCTGDWVAVRPASPATSATVVELLERRTAVVRSTSSRTFQAPGAGRERRLISAKITELSGDCRFADCAHTTEPGCAVLAAVEGGYLTRRRLDSYHRLQRENTYAASRTDARLRAELERPMKQIARQVRALKQSPHFKA